MAKRKQQALYMIGNAHLDPVWLWRWQEGYSEVFATFRSALDRMNENPDFIFTCSSAAYYKWVKEANPSMFEEIKQRVAEGRWQIVGGWWVQPDCNMPAGESFARHALYSQRFYLENFERACTVGYCVDSFGHAYTLPQLLQGGGMDSYVCLRPGVYENKAMPEDAFIWKSPDGSSVTAYRILHSYGSHGPGETENEKMVNKIPVAGEHADQKGQDLMLFYGVGNHGGGPTKRNLQAIVAHNANPDNRRLIFSTPRHYFDHILESGVKLNVYDSEMQHHASGCYSSHSEIKRNNRLAENRLLRAEKFATITEIKQGTKYPDFATAWENVMFNQFHDIMCGCSIQIAFNDAREMHGESLSFAAKTLNFSVQKISKNINTMLPGVELSGKEDWCLWSEGKLPVPMVIFNAEAYETTHVIRLNAHVEKVTDRNGKEVPIQYIQSKKGNGKDIYDTIFSAHLPSLGYNTYWVYKKSETESVTFESTLIATKTSLENDKIKLKIDSKTGAVTLTDKKTGHKVLSNGALPVVVDDTKHDTWAHGIFTFRDDIATMTCTDVKLVESGAVRATLRVKYSYKNSYFVQDFSLTPNSSEVEVECKANWQEKFTILKLSFPVNAKKISTVSEIPYGTIERKPTGEEEVCQTFICAFGETPVGPMGLGIANDSKYSYDCLKNDLRLTVIRNAMYADHVTEDREKYDWEHVDEGVQWFTYKLVPFAGDWRTSGIVRSAHTLNNPPEIVWESYHKGEDLPLYDCFLTNSASNVEVTVFKKAEEGNGYVLRAYETQGKAVKTVFDIKVLGRKLTASFTPYQIKTFLITEDEVKEVNFIEV